MVLELRDKLAKHPLDLNISPLKNNTLHQDALNALTALGISRPVAEQAISRVFKAEPDIVSIEDLIKKSLKSL
jgi:Holliday junction DNA helicase RuvA